MPFPASTFSVIEDTINRLAGEFILAQPGKDDGLIPSYSLLCELAEAVSGEASLSEAILRVRGFLDALLDSARPFDEASLAAVRLLVEWLPGAVASVQMEVALAPFTLGSLTAGENSPDLGDDVDSTEGAGAVQSFDQVLELNLDENRELLTEFHAEAIDHLRSIESSLLTLDEHPQDRDALGQLFRSFHTLKGVSGFLHLTPMHTLTHEVESLLDLARNGKFLLNPTVITAILQSRDAVRAMVSQITRALEQGRIPTEIVPVDHLIATVKHLALSSEGKPSAKSSVCSAPTISTAATHVAVPVEPVMFGAVAPVQSALVAAKVVPFQTGEHGPTAGAEKSPEKKTASVPGESKGLGSSSTVRVNTDKLDAMMDVVGELVIAQCQIAESARALADENSPLARNIAQLGRITKELQRIAMSIRLVAIKPTFQKMERLARDLARDCGKKVVFQTLGEDTEIDRSVVEEIADPLVHMMRNSMDHGLETPDVRVSLGKPESGLVTLKAFHRGSHVHIELSDDGRGIDPDRVYAKAVEKGVIMAGAQLARGEILDLIFSPGFSTAEKITSISGRGVGMDIVRRNIEKLRGTVEIDTVVGKGTTFRVRLPLTMAIIDGLVVRVGADRFVLPSTSVQMALRPTLEAISTVHGRVEVLDHRGKMVPVHRLNRKFSIPDAVENPTDGIIVLVETSDKVTALLVDEMVSKQQVVIKNLGGLLSNLPGIAGGAILGDGTIALILDPSSLFAA